MAANGVPILLRYLLEERLAYPVDFKHSLFDGQRILGDSKTWRGLFGSLLTTCCLSLLLGYSLLTGLMISLGAMSGDLLSSFTKRRLKMPSSSMAPLLDQLPESLIPAILVMHTFHLSITNIIILVLLFIILEYMLSRVLYQLGIRRRPY